MNIGAFLLGKVDIGMINLIMKKFILMTIFFCCLSCFSLFAQGNTSEKQQLKLLCLGDSITQSGFFYPSYRYFLWKNLVDQGFSFDFVGSIDHRFMQMRNKRHWPKQYKSSQFDSDHEGHWGWRCEQILGQNHGDLPWGSGKGHLQLWLKQYTPDLAIIHLGHNDLDHDQSISSTLTELSEIIQILRQHNPQIKIILSQLIPPRRRSWHSKIIKLNQEIPVLAEHMNSRQSAVIWVNPAQNYDGRNDNFDGIHPNPEGARKMADVFFKGILKLLEEDEKQ